MAPQEEFARWVVKDSLKILAQGLMLLFVAVGAFWLFVG